jgi:hypothetical protein
MIFHDKKLTKPSPLSCGLNSQRMEKSSTASSAFRQQLSISGIKLVSGSTARHRPSKFQETDDRYVSSFSAVPPKKRTCESHENSTNSSPACWNISAPAKDLSESACLPRQQDRKETK